MEDYSWVPTSVGVTMQGRNPIRLLLAEARRKPAIAAIVERIPDMTDAEFNDLTMPLPWMKKAVGELRLYRSRQDAQIAAQGYVEDMGAVVTNEPQKGMVVRHTGPDTFWVPPRVHPRLEPLSILIKTGDLMFVTKSETWLSSTPVGFPNLPCEMVEQDVARSRYFELIDLGSPAQMETPINAGGRHGERGFTIFRPS